MRTKIGIGPTFPATTVTICEPEGACFHSPKGVRSFWIGVHFAMLRFWACSSFEWKQNCAGVHSQFFTCCTLAVIVYTWIVLFNFNLRASTLWEIKIFKSVWPRINLCKNEKDHFSPHEMFYISQATESRQITAHRLCLLTSTNISVGFFELQWTSLAWPVKPGRRRLTQTLLAIMIGYLRL